MESNYNVLKSTLTEASKDDDGNSVIESTQEVYDFDEIAKVVAADYRVKKPQRSCDALYIKDDDNIYLLEFKNTRSSNVPKKSLKEKAYDSIMTLLFAFFPEFSLEDVKSKVSLVFVYNNEADSENIPRSDAIESMKNKMKQLSSESDNILFGLEIYKGVLYKNIYTKDKTEFMQNLYGEIFE